MSIEDAHRLVNEATRHRPKGNGADRGGAREFLPFRRLGELAVREPQYIVKPVLELDTTGFLYGDSETAKTLIGLDLAACIALAIPWHGYVVKVPGSVFYVLGEGEGGIARRRAAWEKRYGRSLKDAPLFVSQRPADFFTPAGVAHFIAGVEMHLQAGVPPPVMIQIDTMSRNVGNGFEETTDGVRTLLNHINELVRARWHCCVLLHHHIGHMEKDRMRGPRALVNNSDFAHRTERPTKDGPVVLTCDRMKDGRKPSEMAFNIVPVDLDIVDDDRQPVYGVTVEATQYTKPEPDPKGMGKSQTAMMALLRELYATARANLAEGKGSPEDAEVALDWWKDTGIKRGLISSRQMFHKVKAGLLERQMITIEGRCVRPAMGEPHG